MPPEYPGPIPKPTPETEPFWQALKQRQLRIQRCDDCGQHFFYPRPLCPHCWSRAVRWVDASGRGILRTFVINYRPPRKFPTQDPIVIGLVELAEGPRMMSNIVGVEPDPARLRCDMPVTIVFDDITDDITLPKFQPE